MTPDLRSICMRCCSRKFRYIYAPDLKLSMKKSLKIVLILIMPILLSACNQGKEAPEAAAEAAAEEETSKIVKKRRDDGSLSSLNPVDEQGYIHGVKVNFYEDGVTVHSKITYEHGRKHGSAIWFFKSGKIYEHTEYYLNRRNGVTKRYYESGELYEETSYDTGEELPGKKRYSKEGDLISSN